MHTICTVGRKFVNADPQLFAKVALKFSLKLGGINHVMVASIDSILDKWRADLRIQKRRREMVSDVGDMLIN